MTSRMAGEGRLTVSLRKSAFIVFILFVPDKDETILTRLLRSVAAAVARLMSKGDDCAHL